MKRNSMAQWINLHRNNIFVNQTRLLLLCEKIWSHTASASGSYSRQAGWQSGRQSDKGRFENLNSLRIASVRFSWHLTKVQCYYSVTNAFQSVFWVKYIARHVIEARKSGTPCFFVSIPTIKYYRT